MNTQKVYENKSYSIEFITLTKKILNKDRKIQIFFVTNKESKLESIVVPHNLIEDMCITEVKNTGKLSHTLAKELLQSFHN